jgi:hypothetical protein
VDAEGDLHRRSSTGVRSRTGSVPRAFLSRSSGRSWGMARTAWRTGTASATPWPCWRRRWRRSGTDRQSVLRRGSLALHRQEVEAAGVEEPLWTVNGARFDLRLSSGDPLAASRTLAATTRATEGFEWTAHRQVTGRELRPDASKKISVGEVRDHRTSTLARRSYRSQSVLLPASVRRAGVGIRASEAAAPRRCHRDRGR